jgi:thiol-disulfide isomerase/thioredoxin
VSTSDDGLRVRGDDEAPSTPPTPAGKRLGRLAAELGFSALVLVVGWIGLGWFRSPELPRQAPDFTLTDLDGTRWALSEQQGKTVVLNFWATWCGPCKMEAPGLTRFAKDHPDIPVLGIAVDGKPDAVGKVADAIGIDYPVMIADAATKAAYDVSTLPTTIVVNPDGTIRSAHAGLMLEPHLWWLTR